MISGSAVFSQPRKSLVKAALIPLTLYVINFINKINFFKCREIKKAGFEFQSRLFLFLVSDLFFKKYNQKLYNDVKNPYKTYPFTPTKNGKEISFIENQNYRFSIELDPILMVQRIREEKLNSIGL